MGPETLELVCRDLEKVAVDKSISGLVSAVLAHGVFAFGTRPLCRGAQAAPLAIPGHDSICKNDAS